MQDPIQANSSDGAWPAHPAGRVALLDVDPDLADGQPQSKQRAVVSVLRFGAGALPAAPDVANSRGFIVLKGLLLYESAVCGRAAGELLGLGDVIRPGGEWSSGTVPVKVSWTALQPVLLGDLGDVDDVWVWQALAGRFADRAERVAIERSIGAHVRVDVRVLAYLWHLADRFGTVVPDGVKLGLPLTHAGLARLIGARRPTVTTALQRLIHLGYIVRDGRTFRLLGDASALEDLDQRSPARDFAYPDGDTRAYRP
jgi:hypothetical protein